MQNIVPINWKKHLGMHISETPLRTRTNITAFEASSIIQLSFLNIWSFREAYSLNTTYTITSLNNQMVPNSQSWQNYFRFVEYYREQYVSMLLQDIVWHFEWWSLCSTFDNVDDIHLNILMCSAHWLTFVAFFK